MKIGKKKWLGPSQVGGDYGIPGKDSFCVPEWLLWVPARWLFYWLEGSHKGIDLGYGHSAWALVLKWARMGIEAGAYRPILYNMKPCGLGSGHPFRATHSRVAKSPSL